jgi:DNA (cytosine-5)-methyltransferase 1
MQAGLQGRFAIERDPMAFETFAANFLSASGRAGKFKWPDWLEAQSWDIEEFLAKHRLDLQAEMRGRIDVLTGGPPCQGFSFAGRRVEDDPRNMLFQKYVEVVAAIRPKLLILENVPGMRVAHGGGNLIRLSGSPGTPPRKTYYDKLVESLDAVGYVVKAELIDAADYGVPQRRLRLIAFGMPRQLADRIPGGVGRAFELLVASRQTHLRELGLKGRVSARSAISDLEIGARKKRPCDDPALRGHFEQVDYRGPRSAFQKLMHNGCGPDMDSMRLARHRDDVSDRFDRIIRECRQGVRMDDASRKAFGLKKHRIYPMAASEPAPTITTLPDDILHYSEPRILTVREYARLQSFPDWFKFKGKYTTGGKRRTKECPRYTQVGNAVPPHLARALGRAALALLKDIDAALSAKATTAITSDGLEAERA